MSGLAPPHAALRACVVVPARDEEERIGACLAALAAQRGVEPDIYEVLLVLDACRDATAARARAALAGAPGLRLHTLEGPGRGAGAARRLGMDLASSRLLALGRPDGLIASTDADSRVAPDWLAAQLAAVARGARAIGGRVELAGEEAAALPPPVLAARAARAAQRHARVRAGARPERGDRAEHWQFSGASMALTAHTYRAVGGLPDRVALEDEALERVLQREGVPIERLLAVSATTSARLQGRARRGLARDLGLAAWQERRGFAAGDFALAELLAAKSERISVILPAREVADSVGAAVGALRPLREAGLVDELVVIDAASRDGTARRAEAAGAIVYQEDDLLPEHGPALGKGDAMQRGLAATSGGLVAYLDADSPDVRPDQLVALLGPLILDESIHLVKGAFRRPFRLGSVTAPDEGGRVTELTARPLLNLIAPELAGFRQPLAGEVAARRELLEGLPFPVGYGVEIGMLLDALRVVGIDGLAQVDLGTRQNRHQPLRELSAMSMQVMVTALRRLIGEEAVAQLAPGPLVLWGANGMQVRDLALEERPPLRPS